MEKEFVSFKSTNETLRISQINEDHFEDLSFFSLIKAVDISKSVIKINKSMECNRT